MRSSIASTSAPKSSIIGGNGAVACSRVTISPSVRRRAGSPPGNSVNGRSTTKSISTTPASSSAWCTAGAMPAAAAARTRIAALRVAEAALVDLEPQQVRARVGVDPQRRRLRRAAGHGTDPGDGRRVSDRRDRRECRRSAILSDRREHIRHQTTLWDTASRATTSSPSHSDSADARWILRIEAECRRVGADLTELAITAAIPRPRTTKWWRCARSMPTAR